MFDTHTHDRSAQDAIISCSPDDNVAALPLFSMGIHPWDVDMNWQEKLAFMKERATREPAFRRLVAVGEIGIDKTKGEPLQQQEACFEAQLRWAAELEKPVIIHCVRAVDEVMAVLKKTEFGQPVVFHGFRGKLQQALQLLSKGYFLSFGPFFHAESLKEAYIQKRMFLETDDSGMSISEIYERASKALSISPTDISVPGIFKS